MSSITIHKNGALTMTQRTASMAWFVSFAINTLMPKQYGRHFADSIFKCVFLNENVFILIKVSMTFVHRVQLTIFQHWFNWYVAWLAPNQYLNQWWLVYWLIFASPGHNESTSLKEAPVGMGHKTSPSIHWSFVPLTCGSDFKNEMKSSICGTV